MARWLELPKALWELICKKLDPVACHRFSGTCSSFQSLAIENKCCLLSSPLLMLPGKENSIPREFYSVYDGRTCEINLPELHGKWCLGSSYGWLFTVDSTSGEISLLNPITRAQIQLPPLSTFSDPPGLREKERGERNIKYIERATISENPSISNDFVVIAIFIDLRVFAFCKPGDKNWTTLTKQGDHCEDVIFHKKKFYAITNWGALKRWEHCHVDAPVETIIPAPKDEGCLRRYLVETPGGGLLKVCRHIEWEEDDEDGDVGHSHTLTFKVCILDENGKRWVRVQNLELALFVGYNRAICVSAIDCPGGIQANSIYFTDDYFEGYYESPCGCFDNGVFSLEDESIKQICKKPPVWSTPCIWISPTPR
jgi:hypothetical protein